MLMQLLAQVQDATPDEDTITLGRLIGRLCFTWGPLLVIMVFVMFWYRRATKGMAALRERNMAHMDSLEALQARTITALEEVRDELRQLRGEMSSPDHENEDDHPT